MVAWMEEEGELATQLQLQEPRLLQVIAYSTGPSSNGKTVLAQTTL
jgi:hypothetical protein